MGSVKFAVFTDLHYDHIPDGDRRLHDFISKVKGLVQLTQLLQSVAPTPDFALTIHRILRSRVKVP